MRNCLVAQSGGPTAVINSSAMGVLSRALETKYYDKIYAGLNGIEGVLQKRIKEITSMTSDQIDNFKYTPSSGLGSCRYKMKNFKENDAEYKTFFQILEEFHIEAFFYIGGNDSMDTVYQLSEYAKINNISAKIIGIPKTIDNDLPETDHTPGFGSAAKLIATITMETYLDSSVYPNNGIFVLETMGRDTGWLAASACLARVQGKPSADFIYLPEVAFINEQFLEDVNKVFKSQNQAYVVVSEGIKDENGVFLGQKNASGHDKFGHVQLGGVCAYIKQLITESGITSRVKTQELGVIQRCAMHMASKLDIEEAFMAGSTAVDYSIEGKTGCMLAIKRLKNNPYEYAFAPAEASKVANHIKYFPKAWVNERGNNVTDAAYEYISPLVQGIPELHIENYIPKYMKIK